MRKKLNWVVLTVICLVSLFLIGDTTHSLAQPNLRPDRQILIDSLRGNTEGVRFLLSNGVDPNTPPGPADKGMTAVMFAAWKGHDEIVKLLVAAGANVNARSQTGATSLMYATFGGYENSVRVLLERGAMTEVRLRDETGPTALQYSLRTKNPNIMGMIARQSPPEIFSFRNSKGDTPLLVASKLNNLDFITALLEGKGSLEDADQVGNTPLMYVARKGNTKAVIRLLKQGADPNRKDAKGVSVLAKAKIGKNRAVQQALRKSGAKP